MSAYRVRLRLFSSLEQVCAGEDLTSIALVHGFDSHSHFTAAFHRAFGVPPSRLRGAVVKMRTQYACHDRNSDE